LNFEVLLKFKIKFQNVIALISSCKKGLHSLWVRVAHPITDYIFISVCLIIVPNQNPRSHILTAKYILGIFFWSAANTVIANRAEVKGSTTNFFS
jgi:hypothetical protein